MTARFQSHTNPPIPEINGAPITQVSVAKSLGVLIDNNLNWSSHVDKLTKKVASGIGALKRIRHLVPQTTLRSNITRYFNRTLTTAMSSGETVVSRYMTNYKNCKIEQPEF